jgi:hypothetical protein
LGKKSIKSYAKKNKNKYIFRVLLRHIQHSFTCVAQKFQNSRVIDARGLDRKRSKVPMPALHKGQTQAV